MRESRNDSSPVSRPAARTRPGRVERERSHAPRAVLFLQLVSRPIAPALEGEEAQGRHVRARRQERTGPAEGHADRPEVVAGQPRRAARGGPAHIPHAGGLTGGDEAAAVGGVADDPGVVGEVVPRPGARPERFQSLTPSMPAEASVCPSGWNESDATGCACPAARGDSSADPPERAQRRRAGPDAAKTPRPSGEAATAAAKSQVRSGEPRRAAPSSGRAA